LSHPAGQLVGPGALEAGQSKSLEVLAGLCARTRPRDPADPQRKGGVVDGGEPGEQKVALRIAGVPRATARARAGEHFERLGLAGFEGSRPNELSGGMRQRVAFLRTLMAGRPVLLLDEPFASLDAITRAEMQSWLAGVLGPDRHTVLLVTHDVEEALYLSDRVLVLSSRPASVCDRIEIDGPRAPDRAAAVTSPQFAELKQRALRSLAEGTR
jgi:ABC-type nitrate/sulfonate/bicarbonate transport system ATPase subunit